MFYINQFNYDNLPSLHPPLKNNEVQLVEYFEVSITAKSRRYWSL